MSYQKFTAVGNLTRDPDMKYQPDGTALTHFTIAINKRRKNAEGVQIDTTMWMRCSAWGSTAEVAAKYLTKGRQCLVEGELEFDMQTGNPRIYKKNDNTPGTGFEMRVDRLVLLRDGSQPQSASSESQPQSAPEQTEWKW
jgi:single-strand DNA-binding protein